MRTFLCLVLAGWILLGAWSREKSAEAALEPERLTIGGEIRERYEFRDDADFNPQADDTLGFVGSRIRFNIGYDIAPDLYFFLQMQDSRLFGSESATASNEGNLDLHQGFLTVKNLAGPLTAVLGRQEMAFGDQRLIGGFGWSHIGRSFDGLRLTVSGGPMRLDLWGMIVKQSNTAIEKADPAFPSANRDGQSFYGVYAAYQSDSIAIEPYVLYLRDTGDLAVSAVTDPAGLRMNGKAASDSLEFTGEAAYQTGSMEGRGATVKSDISAYALAFKAAYTLPVEMRPRIGLEYDRASGDNDPGDDNIKTFENLFPTDHIHYGMMDYVGWRNMQGLRLSLGVKPTKNSGIGLDYHRFFLADKADHWYAASGKIFRTAPPGNSSTELGQELDVVVYGMIKEKLRMEAGYGRFYPGEYVKANFPSADDPSDFFYVQTGVGF